MQENSFNDNMLGMTHSKVRLDVIILKIKKIKIACIILNLILFYLLFDFGLHIKLIEDSYQ